MYSILRIQYVQYTPDSVVQYTPKYSVTPFGRELHFVSVQCIPRGKPPCDLLTVRGVTPARKGLTPFGII